jgi:type I restriction enzyme S subunit
MSSEWRRVTVEEIAAIHSSALATGPFGSSICAKYFESSGVPVIRGSNLSPDVAVRLNDHGLVFVSPEKASEFKRSTVTRGDLIFTCWGTINQVGLIDNRSKYDRYVISNKQMKLTVDPAKADARFIYYAFSGPSKQTEIIDNGIGSSVPGFNLGQLRKHTLLLPSLPEQGAIADFLDVFDARISLLRATNAILEAIAQTLFKAWFVDFDPVRAKQDGRVPDGMDEATAALFPDSFEEMGSARRPKGWGECAVYDLATYINGAAYKAFDPNLEGQGLPIIKIAELKAGVSSQTAYSDVVMPEKYRILTGDILFSWSGNPDTSIDTFVWQHGSAWLNQHIFRVVPHAQGERAFLLRTLRYLRPVFAELARNKQTTGLGHVTVADLKRLQVVKPGPAVLERFDRVLAPVHRKMFDNDQRVQTLIALRDTLLPQLISGQLRLPDDFSQIKEAA